jgi:hypothetical protein
MAWEWPKACVWFGGGGVALSPTTGRFLAIIGAGGNYGTGLRTVGGYDLEPR